MSLEVAAAFSMVSLYWNPEQPPASTSRRRESGTEPAASVDFRAAFIAIKRCGYPKKTNRYKINHFDSLAAERKKETEQQEPRVRGYREDGANMVRTTDK